MKKLSKVHIEFMLVVAPSECFQHHPWLGFLEGFLIGFHIYLCFIACFAYNIWQWTLYLSCCLTTTIIAKTLNNVHKVYTISIVHEMVATLQAFIWFWNALVKVAKKASKLFKTGILLSNKGANLESACLMSKFPTSPTYDCLIW